jgi:hypothetical protein
MSKWNKIFCKTPRLVVGDRLRRRGPALAVGRPASGPGAAAARLQRLLPPAAGRLRDQRPGGRRRDGRLPMRPRASTALRAHKLCAHRQLLRPTGAPVSPGREPVSGEWEWEKCLKNTVFN